MPELLAAVRDVGAALVVAVTVALLALAYRSSAMVAALVVGGLADVVFEPWLLAGSVYCLVFWVIVYHPSSVNPPAAAEPVAATERRRRIFSYPETRR